MKKVLVTGGAGFIGRNLCEILLNRGYNVICLDNFYTSNINNIEDLISRPNFTFINHDIINPIEIKVDEIYNLACPASPVHYQRNPLYTWKTCTFGIYNMIMLSLKNKAKLLHTSTSEVYGDPEVHPQVETYWGNVNPIGIRSCYDEGKRSAETILFDSNRYYGADIRVVRIFNTYGPFMQANDGRVVSNFIIQALNNEDITIYGKGDQTRSFCYVDDMVDGLVKMMENDSGFIGPVNLGNPCEFTVLELAQKVINHEKTSSKIVYQPLPPDDPKKRRPNISIAKDKLNWEPKVALDIGLEKTYKYFKSTMTALILCLFLLTRTLSALETETDADKSNAGIINSHLQEMDQLKYGLYKAQELYKTYDVKIAQYRQIISELKFKISHPEKNKSITIKKDDNGEWIAIEDKVNNIYLNALVSNKNIIKLTGLIHKKIEYHEDIAEDGKIFSFSFNFPEGTTIFSSYELDYMDTSIGIKLSVIRQNKNSIIEEFSQKQKNQKYLKYYDLKRNVTHLEYFFQDGFGLNYKLFERITVLYPNKKDYYSLLFNGSIYLSEHLNKLLFYSNTDDKKKILLLMI